jgi:hypothetical protein
MFKHCWNVLKYAPKWLNSHQNETPRRRRTETTSSLNSINLENEDVTNTSNIDLERSLGRKAEKAPWIPWLKKKKIAKTRLEFLEKGCVEYTELENKHLCIKQEKI